MSPPRLPLRARRRPAVEPLEERTMLSGVTIGHVTSFFKPEERSDPIVSYVDPATDVLRFDEAYDALERLDTDYLAYGFWTLEERSPQAWSDFRSVVERVQTERPDTEVYAYIGSPSYGEGGAFCWEEHAAEGACVAPGGYLDYEAWAHAVAELSLEFPVVRGVLIDDFSNEMQRYDTHDVLLTPSYVEAVRSAGRSVAPDFRVEAIFYLNGVSAYSAQRYDDALDAVHFYYRHFDSAGVDNQTDRLTVETEMFSRAFSPSQVSPLATLFRQPNRVAWAGDVDAIETDVQLDGLEQDLVIGHYDSIDAVAASSGWVKKRVYFDGELIAEVDVGDDAVGVYEAVVPYERIEALRAGGRESAVLRFEIATVRAYSSWSYAANVYVRSPEDLFVRWRPAETTGDHTLVTSLDLRTPPDRFLGVYAGRASFMQVTADYADRVLPLALQAVRDGVVDGMVAWEVTMWALDSSVFEAYQTAFDAHALDRRLGLIAGADLFEDWGGLGEKWLRGAGGEWYFLTVDGGFFLWDKSAVATGELIATLAPEHHADPRLLSQADTDESTVAGVDPQLTIAEAVVDYYGLRSAGDIIPNGEGGDGEKWLFGEGDARFFITPDGVLVQWDGVNVASGAVVARLSPGYYDNFQLLTNAKAVAVDTELGLRHTGNAWEDWGGLGEKWLLDRQNRWHYVTPDGVLYRWDTASGRNDLRGERVASLPVEVYGNLKLLHRAHESYVQSGLGLWTDGEWSENWGGRSERWVRGAEGGWFFITPLGELYRWDRSATATGELVAVLDRNAYEDLSWVPGLWI